MDESGADDCVELVGESVASGSPPLQAVKAIESAASIHTVKSLLSCFDIAFPPYALFFFLRNPKQAIAPQRAAEEAKLAQLEAMSDDEIMVASTQRISTDTERLTRRNMKECIAEHIQTLCLDDPAFARKVMHPRKSMIHCIWYINRKAREFAEQEMKDNGFKPENGVYGCDVPDDLCYSWAEDYFNEQRK